jgi:hypothetical protein
MQKNEVGSSPHSTFKHESYQALGSKFKLQFRQKNFKRKFKKPDINSKYGDACLYSQLLGR